MNDFLSAVGEQNKPSLSSLCPQYLVPNHITSQPLGSWGRVPPAGPANPVQLFPILRVPSSGGWYRPGGREVSDAEEILAIPSPHFIGEKSKDLSLDPSHPNGLSSWIMLSPEGETSYSLESVPFQCFLLAQDGSGV